MVGAHGEVQVLDWGLARVSGRRDLAAELGDLPTIITDRSQDSIQATRMGAVAGTPSYMAPEQARGEQDRVAAWSDIYSLGAILYELLSGRPPYIGPSAATVLDMVRSGPPEPLEADGSEETFDLDAPPPLLRPPLPTELVEVCQQAMARQPEQRFTDAGEMAGVVRGWLDGARRRERARAVVDDAQALAPKSATLRTEAAERRRLAEDELGEIKPWEPEERKAAGWDHLDAADELERRASLTDFEAETRLHGALTHAPDLEEAHAALASRYRTLHRQMELQRNRNGAARVEGLLRQHATALPASHPERVSYFGYLEGHGALTLRTDPPGAEIRIFRYVQKRRRRVMAFERTLGRQAAVRVRLSMDSYLCLLIHPDRVPVRYPVYIGRQEHWNGVRPGERTGRTVHLPRPGELDERERYVPGGWFWCGGDAEARNSLPRERHWIDAFVIQRFPVTNLTYMAFLDDLVSTGDEAAALRAAPRERAGVSGEQGSMIYGRTPSGRFALRRDADGDIWDPQWPVMMVDWHSARAFAAWLAARTGQPWRLPTELEWEKAARGVDGRLFPWGDTPDPSWCCMRESHAGRPLPAPVDSFSVDESPYGVRGMAGNVRDWCSDDYRDGLRVFRGGSWDSSAAFTRVACRNGSSPGLRAPILGFRLARSVGRLLDEPMLS